MIRKFRIKAEMIQEIPGKCHDFILDLLEFKVSNYSILYEDPKQKILFVFYNNLILYEDLRCWRFHNNLEVIADHQIISETRIYNKQWMIIDHRIIVEIRFRKK